MSLRLHAFPASPRNFKVLVTTYHLGLDHELRIVDLSKGEQSGPDYAAINPNMKAPALEDGPLKLWESNAIVAHLASKKPEAGLMGADERAQSDVLRWLFWESTTWDPACVALVFERVVKPTFGGGAPDPVEIEKGLVKFNAAAAILDAHLKGRRFICGDALTAADFSLGAAMTMAQPAQYPLDAYAEIRRWSASLAALPAWRAASEMQAQYLPRAAA